MSTTAYEGGLPCCSGTCPSCRCDDRDGETSCLTMWSRRQRQLLSRPAAWAEYERIPRHVNMPHITIFPIGYGHDGQEERRDRPCPPGSQPSPSYIGSLAREGLAAWAIGCPPPPSHHKIANATGTRSGGASAFWSACLPRDASKPGARPWASSSNWFSPTRMRISPTSTVRC